MIDPRFYTLSAPQSLRDVADQCGVELPTEGAGDEIITAPASLATSQSGHIAFFSNKRRKDQLETASATACLTTERLAAMVAEKGIVPLITDDPRTVFARVTQSLASEGTNECPKQEIDPTADIHASAVIGDGVVIGAGTKIGANAVIDDGVVIGADCNIYPLTHIAFTIMGDRCVVKSGAVIGGSGFGIAGDQENAFSIPHLGRVRIGDNVLVGSNSCVDRGQLGDTVLSDRVKIDNQVQIGHNVFIDTGARLAGHAGVSGSCHIGCNVMFGGRAGTADHITIGDNAIVAAYAGIMSDIPEGEMWSGTPAMPIREHMRNVATLKKLSKK